MLSKVSCLGARCFRPWYPQLRLESPDIALEKGAGIEDVLEGGSGV